MCIHAITIIVPCDDCCGCIFLFLIVCKRTHSPQSGHRFVVGVIISNKISHKRFECNQYFQRNLLLCLIRQSYVLYFHTYLIYLPPAGNSSQVNTARARPERLMRLLQSLNVGPYLRVRYLINMVCLHYSSRGEKVGNLTFCLEVNAAKRLTACQIIITSVHF